MTRKPKHSMRKSHRFSGPTALVVGAAFIGGVSSSEFSRLTATHSQPKSRSVPSGSAVSGKSASPSLAPAPRASDILPRQATADEAGKRTAREIMRAAAQGALKLASESGVPVEVTAIPNDATGRQQRIYTFIVGDGPRLITATVTGEPSTIKDSPNLNKDPAAVSISVADENGKTIEAVNMYRNGLDVVADATVADGVLAQASVGEGANKKQVPIHIDTHAWGVNSHVLLDALKADVSEILTGDGILTNPGAPVDLAPPATPNRFV